MIKIIKEISEIPVEGKVILDFFTEWCGPCKKIAPVYEELSKKFKNIAFFKVNADISEEIAEKYDVTALPTFIFIVDGSITDKFSISKDTVLTQKVSEF